MAYKTTFSVPEKIEIETKPIIFRVDKDGKRLGRVVISKTRLEWRPRNKSSGYKFNWEDFSKLDFDTLTKKVTKKATKTSTKK